MSSEASSASQPLLGQPTESHPTSCQLKKTAALLLLIKLCSNTYEYQMMAYNVEFHSEGNQTSACEHRRQPQNCMLSLTCTAAAIAAYTMPTLGGILCDVLLGCLPTLWLGTAVHAVGSCLLTAMDRLNVMCLLPIYLLTSAAVLLHLSLNDAVLIHAVFRLAYSSSSRQVLAYLYFAAATIGETLGSLPSLLRLSSSQSASFEIICLGFGVAHLVGMSQLAVSAPPTVRIRFEMPRLRQLRRFYLITAGTMLPVACMLLCRYCLYWQQIQFFTKAAGDEVILAYYVPYAGYQAAVISLSLLTAAAVFKFGTPRWLSFINRVRAGFGLAAVSKVPLVLLSSLDYNGTISMQSWSQSSVWLTYLAFSFADGATNLAMIAASYEMIYSIANKSAKATMVGIFYTVWGLGVFLSGALERLLVSSGILALGDNETQPVKPMVHYAYGVIIGLQLLGLAYWEKISWPLASGLLPSDAELEEQFHELHDESSNTED